jgi:hypothetical protein
MSDHLEARATYSQSESACYPLGRRLCSSHNWSGPFGEQNISCFVRNWIRIQHSAHSLITLLNSLPGASRIRIYNRIIWYLLSVDVKHDCLVWHSEDRAVWYIFIIKANEMQSFSNLFDKLLYMFWTGPLSIIRSISTLYRCNRYLSC